MIHGLPWYTIILNLKYNTILQYNLNYQILTLIASKLSLNILKMGQVLGKLGLIMLISQQFCSWVSSCESFQTNGNYLKQ